MVLDFSLKLKINPVIHAWVNGGLATQVEIRTIGDKLISGANWTRNEVAKCFESLRNVINVLVHKIGIKQQAATLKFDS